MRVRVEIDQCEGHGQCQSADAGLFQLDADGFAARADVEVPAGSETAAAAGVAACPMAAIRIVEG